jgi:hypothetical protein
MSSPEVSGCVHEHPPRAIPKTWIGAIVKQKHIIYIYVPLDPPKLKMLKQQSSAILGRGILSEWKP